MASTDDNGPASSPPQSQPQSPARPNQPTASIATTTATAAASGTAADESTTATPELDLSKLKAQPSEQQDLYLLTFVSGLAKHVLELDADDCTAQQFYLKKEIFQILNLSTPSPSRVIRSNLGRCLAHIFGKGDRKLLFETVNDLVGIISGGKSKSEAELRTKHAAVTCLGEVFAAAGDSAVGLHQLSCSTLLKFLKAASSHAGIRAAIFTALERITGMVQTALDEYIARDIWKQGRNHASSDKGALVVASACRCLKALARHTGYFRNSNDFDKLESALLKAFDSPVGQVRHAAADCFAEAMVQGYSELATTDGKGKKTKPKLKRASTHPGIPADDEELPARTNSPAPGGKRSSDLALSLTDMLKQLAAHFVKSSSSNRTRAALGVCYCQLFRRLGEKLIEANYLRIVESLTTDILGQPAIYNHRYRLLISRKMIDTIIQDVIGRRILGESGQISAAKQLINDVLKNYPQAMAEKPEPSKHTLITVLSAVSSLMTSLGPASNSFAETCRDGLLQVLQHPSYSVQVYASHCMKVYVVACPQQLLPCLSLQDLDLMVQRRVLQCYIKLINLSPAGSSEALLQSNLLTLAIALFADPENYAPSSLSASIANAAGNFESIWDVGDNTGFGITGLVSGFNVRKLPGQQQSSVEAVTDNETPESAIDALLRSPVCGSLEHDASVLYIGDYGAGLTPHPPATEVIDAAIQLFAFAFPLTPAKVQESILEQIRTFASAGPLQRDPGRKAAINVNTATAILSTMRVAMKETTSTSGSVENMAVERLLQDIVRDFVLDPDQYVRSLGYAAVARLCNVYGNAFTNQEVKFLVDTIVSNREPSARAGCAMALGSIQTKVGGMAAGYHLKTILGILMSLCNDPHSTVHYWALEALSLASDAAGLSFAGYVPSSLGMLAQLYVSETHHCEVSTVVTMNMEMELPTTAAIAKGVDSLINVLGPDLQDSLKSRELIFVLVGQFQRESDLLVQKAALGCLEHLSLYAPGYMQFGEYVRLLQKYLHYENVTLRDIAVDGLYNIMKREPRDVLREANDGFEEQIWRVLDTEPSHDGIRNLIRNWMLQTCLAETEDWLQRFQSVLKMTRAKSQGREEAVGSGKGGMPDLDDEEVAGFAAASGDVKQDKDNPATSEVEPLRWQVTTFAVSCIHAMFVLVAKDVMANGESQAQAALQARVADVVRMAFSASTSSVSELRVWGLKIIGAVLRMFGKAPDPDFEEAMLLEQYQAQISSALTPAFAADSSPELASEAVNICASFISTGIVTDIDRMGRILKTLVNALESFAKDGENACIGDLKGLSSNAQVMVKLSVFSAWAELQVASTEQKYLLDVLKPHVGTLTPLWLEALREFAQLRFEPDISMTLGPPSLSGSLDTIYAALNRETLLRFYQDAWLKLVDAIASLIEQDSNFVFDALDGKGTIESAGNDQGKRPGINYRDEPVAFFFVLFGLAFEALAVRPSHGYSLATQEQTLAILQALKKILHPSVSGHAIYRPDVFAETMDLLDRLVLTEGLDVQGAIVEISSALCVAHPSARRHGSEEGDLSEDIDQLFELTRIIVLTLTGLLPNLSEGNQPVRHQMNEEAILLVRSSLDALVNAAEVFPSIIKTDLHACIIHIFATTLATSGCQEMIVPQSLPTLKRFVRSMSASRKPSDEGPSQTDVQLQGCLRRFLSIYLNAQKREAHNSLLCVRNCLLASTILFTSGENHMPATDPLVARYLDEVLDCLTDRMTAKIAANCIRSLLVQPTRTAADESIARYLFPRLIAFVTDAESEDPERARSLVSTSLCQFVTTVDKSRVSPAMALLIPTLLARTTIEGEGLYSETSSRLLELAATDQEVFRAVVGGMSAGQRSFLEEVIRSGQLASRTTVREASDGDSGQPSIALKMDFGN
ncbi:putative heat repeat protein [Emericellopsis cladophorae]|uniref:Heat repeat protein n=1 Tax=Emericellopsis cladophorae TaxID=2686198 RepID=A0A9P9Y9V4_9HYPO|nr:putative heat repeat protein [Emericellopsis cladophorae]KAI6785730.1 putative heat repeat protein [Emericellopsis cladophorae]